MRPLELYLEGFTVYREPVRLDFRPLNFFAIQGSTGAGKTSLVDAITFALYGKVPRYGNSQAIRKVLSKGSRKLKVSLDFSVNGKEYRVERFYSRFKNKEEVIARAYEGDVKLNYKSKEIESWVEKVTGIDYKTFTKVIILPQGEFDRFLKPSTPKERKDILIKLVNLEVLDKVRERASEEYRAYEREYEILKEKLQELSEYTPAKVKELNSSIEKLKKEIVALRTRREKLEADMGDARKKEELLKRQSELSRTLDELKAEEGRIEALKERLEFAKRVLPFVGLIGELDNLDEEIRKDKQKLNKYRGELSALKQELENALEDFTELEKEHKNIENLERELLNLRLRKQELEGLHKEAKRLKSMERDRDRLSRELEKLELEYEELQERIKKGESLIEDLKDRLKEVHVDNDEYRRLLEKKQRLIHLIDLERKKGKLEESLREKQSKLELLRSEIARLEEEKEQEETKLREKELLYHSYLIRQSLSEGDVCPVCGGTYRGSNEVGEVGTEELREAHERLETVKENLAELERKALKLEAEANSLRRDISDMEETLEGLEVLKSEGVEEKLGAMEIKIKEQEEIKAKLEKYESKLKELVNSKEKVLRSMEGTRTHLENLSSEIERLRTSLGDLDDESILRELKSIEREVDRLDRKINDVKSRYEKYRKYIEDVKAEIIAREAGIKELERVLSSKESRKRQILGKLAPLYDMAPSLEEIKDKAMTGEEIDALEREISTYNEKVSGTVAHLREIEKELNEMVHVPPLGELEEEYDRIVERLDNLSQELGGKQRELSEVEGKINERKLVEGKLPEVESYLRIYERLKEDLRSDRFQSFVANMLMKDILEHASYYLERFSGVYSFDMDEKDNLLILDRSQGGVERTVESLSGGETFLASLSLALGVSDVLSSDAHLESLFIDEGFGSLDEETRERVGDILEVLKLEINKMVGVITHIPEFAERFSQRIYVKKSAGVSKVEVIY